MQMTVDLDAVERSHRGWLLPGICPPCRVHLDGVELQRVTAASVSKGRARVVDDPIKISKHGSVIERTLCGSVRVELI